MLVLGWALALAMAGCGTAASTPTTPAASTTTSSVEASDTGTLPPARYGHSMAYDPASGTVVLFAGRDFHGGFNDTWAYEPSANSWTELAPAGSVP
jgi:hypothetical protein